MNYIKFIPFPIHAATEQYEVPAYPQLSCFKRKASGTSAISLALVFESPEANKLTS